MANSTPAAPRTIVVSLGEIHQDIRFSIASSHLGANIGTFTNSFLLFFFGGKKKEDIQNVKILPGDVTVQQGETVDFSAIAYDSEDEPVNGVKFEWMAEDIGRVRIFSSMRNGRFRTNAPGEYKVKASTEDGFEAEVKVTVEKNDAFIKLKKLEKDRREGNLDEIKKLEKEGKYKSEEIDTKKVYKSKQEESESTGIYSTFENIYGWFFGKEKTRGGPNAESSPEYENAASKTSTMVRPADEDGWGNDNWWMADDPNNNIGNPPGGSPEAGAGNGNFQLSVPIAALPGRGIDLNLSLYYNSRLWSKSGTKMTYDADKGSPAAGWSLGFGKLMFMGTSGGCMMVDAQGTRHGYTGTVSNYNNGGYSSTSFTGQATDGTFIDYSCYYSQNGTTKSLSGSAKLPDGTIITYGSPTTTADQAYPTRITDSQGNYINITYRSNRGPDIATVTDTLGRVVTFNYDTLNRLISVTVPQLSGGTRTAIQLHYKQITLSPGFYYTYTTDTATNTPYVIDAIYYPATSTGYWFNDSDSYSSYGMIAKVKEMRGMTISGNSSTVQGTITAGTMSKEAKYDYPLTADYTLTDAPTYPKLTESWAGMDIDPATDPVVTEYSIDFNSSPRTITVTQPNGLKSKQYMYNASGQWNDGLIYQDETLDASNNVISKSIAYWQQGAYSSPRPYQTEVIDERGQTLKTVNTYGTSYNQLTSVKEYDYDQTTLIRETKNTYENSANYTNHHIFNLVKSTEVLNGSGVKMARTVYEYDNAPLADTPGVVMYDDYYDPNTDIFNTECGECLEYYNYTCLFYEGCYESNAQAQYKGNLTKVTSYADAQSQTGAVEETRTYDITGNTITSSSSCCELNTINYNSTTQYAYPVSQTRGSASAGANQNTASAVYDFNTGLVTQTTDANGRTDTSTYDADTLRPTQQTSSTGAYTQYTYNESAMTVTSETKESTGATASKSIQYLNGIGQVVKEEALGAGGVWDIVETQYTKLGQVWKQTRPYRANETKYWSENFYDIQGRTIKTKGADESETEAFYNLAARPDSASTAAGQTIKVIDAWGRERWGRYNALGNLAEVVEPNPDGNGQVASMGNMVTNYSYDSLGRLTQTNQGGQLRSFKYDDLSRLTRQKLAEKTATLTDAGAYVGSGGSGAIWSDAFSYDNRSNMIQKTDARGVKTNYSYQNGGADDPLNRIQSVSYDLSGPHDPAVIAATSVSYQYKTSGDKERISKVTANWVSTEDYQYDVEGRVSEYKLTLDSRPSYPMTTNYIYDTLNRITDVQYPAQYGLAGSPRKLVNHSYDVASRVSSLKVDGQEQAGNIVFNASSQTTSIKVGPAGTNQVTETYAYNDQTGLLTNQMVLQGGSAILNLSYGYDRLNSKGSSNSTGKKTGHLTKITNNLVTNGSKDREYEFDALGRLTKMIGGNGLSTQTYTYDRYGNRTSVAASGNAADNTTMPRDGLTGLTYNSANNRITTSGYSYDEAGNLKRGQAPDGTWQNYEYDAANRLLYVKDDTNWIQQANEYGSSNARLASWSYASVDITYYSWGGGGTLAEYTSQYQNSSLTWQKSYIYFGDTVLSTVTKTGTTQATEFNHPDRLGTRTVTNQVTGSSSEQVSLPFGTALNAESTTSLSKRFTSYERSDVSGLDYAVNRTYNPGQGRFTQVDPIGMGASSLASPQTLNLYTYCGNDPINHTDPSGLFWGFFKKLFKWILIAVAVIVAVITIAAAFVTPTLVSILGGISAGANAASQVLTGLGYKKAGLIFGIIAAATGFGSIIAAKINGTSFASGGENVDLTGAWYGALGGVGAIANSFRGRNDNKEKYSIIRQTVIDVINRLASNSKCLDLIKGRSKESPIDVIAKLHANYKIIYNPLPSGDVAAAPRGKGSNGEIDIYEKFFTKSVGGYAEIYGINSLRARQLTLLHELSHLSGETHDRDDILESLIITDKIAKICFGVTPKKR